MYMNTLKRSLSITVFVGILVSYTFNPALATPVDLELSLLFDVSLSVSPTEFALQRDGYKTAFNSPTIQSAITGGPKGKIAVNLVYWSSTNLQSQAIGWTLIDSNATSSAFATTVGSLFRPRGGATNPGAGVSFAIPLFDNNDFEGDRLVIDISGDGIGSPISASRAKLAAISAGIDINALAIETPFVETWYQDNLVTPGGFTGFATDFFDFESAIATKLFKEISGGDPTVIPEPTSMVLLGTGLLCIAGFKRRRKFKPFC